MLAQTARDQRLTVRNALDSPALGLALVRIARWLELPEATTPSDSTTNTTLWAKRRMERLNKQLKAIPRDSDDPDVLHAARIVSKQLRYCTEALGPLLPKRHAKRWRKKATAMQTNIGAMRDFTQALKILAQMPAAPDLLAFPDYDGNGMFKSLGNITANPHVGLLFISMGEKPQRLRVNGRASLHLDDALMAELPGAQAVVRVVPTDIFGH